MKHLHLVVPRLGLRGTLAPLPHPPFCVVLKQRNKFAFLP